MSWALWHRRRVSLGKYTQVTTSWKSWMHKWSLGGLTVTSYKSLQSLLKIIHPQENIMTVIFQNTNYQAAPPMCKQWEKYLLNCKENRKTAQFNSWPLVWGPRAYMLIKHSDWKKDKYLKRYGHFNSKSYTIHLYKNITSYHVNRYNFYVFMYPLNFNAGCNGIHL